ncbi:MAG: DUF2219 family protein [Rhodobacter sp.]|nr:DUF2219 family protein [Rhodobacter sp.]
MFRAVLACLTALLLCPPDAAAAKRESLGWGRLFNNDFLGDNRDRWRTGSYVVSKVIGRGWDGRLPDRPGDVIEFRFRSETIAPENIVTAAPGDRRYVGALSLGAHTHFRRKAVEVSLGADLVVTGPQTGLGDLQTELHRILGASRPGVLGNQILDGFHPTALIELARPYRLSPSVVLRPFVEAQGGAETLVRLGGDVMIGRLGQDELMLRDVATGHRYRVNRGAHTGFAAVFGADIAHVEHSVYLPAYDGIALTDTRTRLRAGVHWQGEKASAFYGLTWLGEEFVGQPEGQLVGSVRLNIRF